MVSIPHITLVIIDLVPLQEFSVLILECKASVMLFLPFYIADDLIEM